MNSDGKTLIQPLKMELIEGSKTSANHNRTPGKYPKEYIQYSKHGGSLKSRKPFFDFAQFAVKVFTTCEALMVQIPEFFK